MTPEISLLLGSIIGGTGALLSYWAGWRARGAHERRSSRCGGGEITRAQWEAMGTRLTEGRTQRGNGNNPTTPKPLGYQPRPSRPGANPPPREP